MKKHCRIVIFLLGYVLGAFSGIVLGANSFPIVTPYVTPSPDITLAPTVEPTTAPTPEITAIPTSNPTSNPTPTEEPCVANVCPSGPPYGK